MKNKKSDREENGEASSSHGEAHDKEKIWARRIQKFDYNEICLRW